MYFFMMFTDITSQCYATFTFKIYMPNVGPLPILENQLQRSPYKPYKKLGHFIVLYNNDVGAFLFIFFKF